MEGVIGGALSVRLCFPFVSKDRGALTRPGKLPRRKDDDDEGGRSRGEVARLSLARDVEEDRGIDDFEALSSTALANPKGDSLAEFGDSPSKGATMF